MRRKFDYKAKYLSEAMCKTTFYTLGPLAAKQWLSVIKKWVQSRGLRDTSRRLKLLMTVVNLKLDGQHEVADQLLRQERLSWNSRALSTIRVVYNSLLNCRSDIKSSRLYTVLKLYTGLEYTPSEDDRKALIQTITQPNSQDNLDIVIMNIIDNRWRYKELHKFDVSFTLELFTNFIKWYKLGMAVPVDIISINNNKKRFTSKGRLDKFVAPSNSVDQKVVMDLLNSPTNGLLGIDLHDRSLGRLDRVIDTSKLWKKSSESKAEGELVIIPKPGADGRVIAKLGVLHQLVLHNHHKNLDDIRSNYNNIFAWKDQGSMAMFAKYSQYKASTDLKSATDRIPRKLIGYYLQYLLKYVRSHITKDSIYDFWTSNHKNNPNREIEVPEEDIFINMISKYLSGPLFAEYVLQWYDLINHIANQKWLTPFGDIVSYAVGQPMGMYSSFPWLDITNYLVASASDTSQSTFMIVGDDIIFSSYESMSKYMGLCHDLGVGISDTKTYSNGFAQAVGREVFHNYWAALPMKFSNHKHVNDKTMIMWYSALFPNLSKYKFSPSQLNQFRIQWRNNSINNDITPIRNYLQFNRKAFSDSFTKLFDSMTVRLNDSRLTNFRKTSMDEKDIREELIRKMKQNSQNILYKLAFEKNKSDKTIELSDLSMKRDAQAEEASHQRIGNAIPHTIQDRVKGNTSSKGGRGRR